MSLLSRRRIYPHNSLGIVQVKPYAGTSYFGLFQAHSGGQGGPALENDLTLGWSRRPQLGGAPRPLRDTVSADSVHLGRISVLHMTPSVPVPLGSLVTGRCGHTRASECSICAGGNEIYSDMSCRQWNLEGGGRAMWDPGWCCWTGSTSLSVCVFGAPPDASAASPLPRTMLVSNE